MNPTSALPDDIELLERLGEGTFGQVFSARLQEGPLQRTVVLKVLKADWMGHAEVAGRARDEAALLSRLSHDNIVRVESLTTWRGRLTVVMEHIQGLTLDKVLRENGPLPTSTALEVIARVASALDAAYNSVPPGETRPLRVIHRDIKPSNILISLTGGVKVLDFGTARGEFDSREASTQLVQIGSPMYMAPECFDGDPPTPEVDVYAMGATLFELLSGQRLGRMSVKPHLFGKALAERLAALNPPDVPDEAARAALRDLVGRLLRYDPERRPTAADVRRLTREFLLRSPVRATPLDQYAELVVEPLYRNRPIAVPSIVEDDSDVLSGPAPSMQTPPVELPPPMLVEASAPPTQHPRWLLVPVAVIGVTLGLVSAIFVTLDNGPKEPEPLPVEALPPERAVVVAPPEAPVAPPKVEPAPPPKVEPAPPPKVEAAPKEEVAVKPEPTRRTKPPPPAQVEVTLRSKPAGATVTLAGVTTKLPQPKLTLPEGRYTAKVSFSDPAAEGVCSVQISPGGVYTFALDGAGGVTCP
ncbi:serine/threonine protein kinase [Myxococcota bacterium]|nr:serine/threonine protein kinase [Myxococcota bacterium]